MSLEIISRKVDTITIIVHRVRNHIVSGDAHHCYLETKLSSDLNLQPQDFYKKGSATFMNRAGMGLKSTTEKAILTFRGEIFLTKGFGYFEEWLLYIKLLKYPYTVSRLDIATDYRNDELVPFKKGLFTKCSKKTICQPLWFRATEPEKNLQWKMFNTRWYLIFYQKTEQIKEFKLQSLYPESYLDDEKPVYRMELRFTKETRISVEQPEADIIKQSLNYFIKKHPFSDKNKKVAQLFHI